jgi:hypothetical protein
MGEGMEIGIGLNEEYNFTPLFDFDFVEFSRADVAVRLELEALLLALADFDVTGLTIMSYIPTILIYPLRKTIDLIQLFDSVNDTYLSTPPPQGICA